MQEHDFAHLLCLFLFAYRPNKDVQKLITTSVFTIQVTEPTQYQYVGKIKNQLV